MAMQNILIVALHNWNKQIFNLFQGRSQLGLEYTNLINLQYPHMGGDNYFNCDLI